VPSTRKNISRHLFFYYVAPKAFDAMACEYHGTTIGFKENNSAVFYVSLQNRLKSGLSFVI
jgi:hypothetical protein